MDNKNFCGAHWAGTDEREDRGGRTVEVFPDPGQSCSFCAEPATHCGPFEPKVVEPEEDLARGAIPRHVAESIAGSDAVSAGATGLVRTRKSVRP